MQCISSRTLSRASIGLGCVVAWLLAAGCGGGGGGGWEPAFDAEPVGWLMNVGGSGPDDLYAVGGSAERGVVMHWDGAEWSEVGLGVDVPLLNWVHAFGPDDVLAVGNGGTVLHFDGTGWSLQETPVENDLWGVWGASPDDVWAVGGRGRMEGQQTLLRWDGSTWREVPVPDLERPNVYAFFKVWGTGPDDVWIVGQRGAVLHWDGSALTEHLVGASQDLIALWGTGPDDVVVVGGRSNGVVSLWDGEDWRTESLAPLPGLNGVWMREPGLAHVAGINGTIAELDLETLEHERAEVDTRLDFHAIYGDGEKLTAVGGSLARQDSPYEGLAWTRALK